MRHRYQPQVVPQGRKCGNRRRGHTHNTGIPRYIKALKAVRRPQALEGERADSDLRRLTEGNLEAAIPMKIVAGPQIDRQGFCRFAV